MRDKKRINRILKKIGKLWLEQPDQRLGQFLENYVFFKGQRGDVTSISLFYQDDNITEEILDKQL